MLINYFFNSANLHTWKQAQILLAVIFSIGTDGAVIPDNNRWRSDHLEVPASETPARIVLRGLISTLEFLWFMGKTEATIPELEVCHIVSRNTAINLNAVYTLKQFVVNRSKRPKRNCGMYPSLPSSDVTIHHFYYHGVKFSYMTTLACFQRLFGLTGSGKDTEMTESFHKKVVKAPLEAISNNTAGRDLECARYMQKTLHAECMMHKTVLSNETEKSDGVELSPDSSAEDNLFQCKSFRRQQLWSKEGKFCTPDSSFIGHPFLHPRISLEILHITFCVYHENLMSASTTSTTRREHYELGLVLQLHAPSTRGLLSHGPTPKLFLTEAVKRSSNLRCGDLKHTRGVHFLRSTQEYSDDRRAIVSQRSFHALNSFCFARIPDGRYCLVRILCIAVLDGTLTPTVYCLVVVLNRAKPGFLPYDIYKYSYVDDGTSPPYADVLLLNADNISCPAFCVSVDPTRFKAVDDLLSDGELYYCIPPQRVLCKKGTYEEILSLNSEEFDAFRSVIKMNDMNRNLEEKVAAFNISAVENRAEKAAASAIRRKEQAKAKKDAKKRDGQVAPSGGRTHAPRQKKKNRRESSSEESNDEDNSSLEDRDGNDDNVFGE